jgi:hypothetical protein
MTYDPRERNPVIPFDLFPRQVEFLEWLAEREARQEHGLVEKSRDMGITWLCCAYALHGWFFRDGYQVGFGSRKLEYVDKIGDPGAIFEKLRFLWRNLPRWMLPPGFRSDMHDCYTKLINPANGSTITGEGGDNIGRGGRSSIYFVDESAFLERPESVERSLSQTTNVRIDVSTHNGPGTVFYRKRFGGKVAVFIFDWKDDPRKNEKETLPDGREVFPWYEEQKARFDPVTVAQEIDHDPTASLEGICIPAAWVRAAVELQLPESGSTRAGLDIAEEGVDLNVFIPRRGPVVKLPISWGQCNTTETAHRAADEAERQGVTALNYDCIGVGAGVRGTLTTSERALRFTPNAVNVGESPSEDVWPDGKTSKERFLNLRAELWWKLRGRFEKAFEFKEHGTAHPPDEMISIPNHPELIADLSMPLYFRTETGKIKLESKEAMRRRGVKSPDYGDALALAFFEGRELWIPDVPSKSSRGERVGIAGVPRGVFDSDDPKPW